MTDTRLISPAEDMVAGLSRKLASRPGREAGVLVLKLDHEKRALKIGWESRLVAQVAFLPPFDGAVLNGQFAGAPYAIDLHIVARESNVDLRVSPRTYVTIQSQSQK